MAKRDLSRVLGIFVRISCRAAGRGLQAGFAGAFPNSLSSLSPFPGRSSNKAFAGCSLRAQQLSSCGLLLSFCPNTVKFNDLVEGAGTVSCLWLREVVVLGLLFQWKHLVLQRRLKANAMSTSFC